MHFPEMQSRQLPFISVRSYLVPEAAGSEYSFLSCELLCQKQTQDVHLNFMPCCVYE